MDIKCLTWGADKRLGGYHIGREPQGLAQPAALEAPTQGGRRGGEGDTRAEETKRDRGPEEEGPQAPRAAGQGPEGRPASLRVQRVSRGWLAQGPPPEPDARAPALKRAACASCEKYESQNLETAEERGAVPVLSFFCTPLVEVLFIFLFLSYLILSYLSV